MDSRFLAARAAAARGWQDGISGVQAVLTHYTGDQICACEPWSAPSGMGRGGCPSEPEPRRPRSCATQPSVARKQKGPDLTAKPFILHLVPEVGLEPTRF